MRFASRLPRFGVRKSLTTQCHTYCGAIPASLSLYLRQASYRQLNSHFPTTGALIAAAFAYVNAGDVALGLAELATIRPGG